MKLIQIYECLCDETRLRILNLLSIKPLCVSDIQKALQMTQVKVSKHLTYMKERELVESVRVKNKVFYSISKQASPELDNNMQCLQNCSKEYQIFKDDLKRLKRSEDV